ncbi:hypothetical protein BU14_0930s0007 [Porphyra umbilicalis]|uniref:MSP domain-containing protein n=1 Tax=Porphyra umbilicalis TaxID=2786 RepID=A0A1X6NNC1_PORUM|nr:hypothetical protein BU14_0930s0007 [Porphyra umbilicalis]|eukprot:OSX70075.1 hypothetical protein BU14_0930s0007 [Porphyra umbilicalis]
MESLLHVQPPNVDFPATSAPAGGAGDYASAWLRLGSASAEPVAFKVKTTKPSRYCVRPNHGVVLPGGGVDVEVICLEPPPPSPGTAGSASPVVICRDKFLIQAAPAGAAVATVSAPAAEFWAAVPAGGLVEHKMKVAFAPPASAGGGGATPTATAMAAAATAAAASTSSPPPSMHPPSAMPASGGPPLRFSTPAEPAPLQPVRSTSMDAPVLPAAVHSTGAAAAAADEPGGEEEMLLAQAAPANGVGDSAATAMDAEWSRREALLAAAEARVTKLEDQLDASVAERDSLTKALIDARAAASMAEAQAAEATATTASAMAAAAEADAVARVTAATGGGAGDEVAALTKGPAGRVLAQPAGGISYLYAFLLCFLVALLTKLFL